MNEQRRIFAAAVFDMDGLLIDSEPLWRQAERRVFADVGLDLTDEDCTRTTGLRIDEVVGFWFAKSPWTEPAPEVVGRWIVREVIALIREKGAPLPGAEHALSLCQRSGLRLALASSSSPRIIDATLERLGLVGRFEVVQSAASEKRGKPHPDVYLSTCARLGLQPSQCVAFEDSPNGIRAARAAGMYCIAVPGMPEALPAVRSLADTVLPSLAALEDRHLRLSVE